MTRTDCGESGDAGPEGLSEDRLRELYVERDLTVREIATRRSRSTATVLAALRRTEFYEPKTATLVAELDPADVLGDD